MDAAQKQGTPHSDVRKIEFSKKKWGIPKTIGLNTKTSYFWVIWGYPNFRNPANNFSDPPNPSTPAPPVPRSSMPWWAAAL